MKVANSIAGTIIITFLYKRRVSKENDEQIPIVKIELIVIKIILIALYSFPNFSGIVSANKFITYILVCSHYLLCIVILHFDLLSP